MSVSINAGPEQKITRRHLKGPGKQGPHACSTWARRSSPTSINPYRRSRTSITANVQYDSGNQKWDLNVVGFNLSGGVTGQIEVVKSGKLYDYTDSFPPSWSWDFPRRTTRMPARRLCCG